MGEVSLKEYTEARLRAVEKATDLAANTLEKRLEGMNEFRQALKSQSSTFVTRTEVDVQIAKIHDDIRTLRESKARLEGKASQLYVTVTLVIAILGLMASIISIVYIIK